MLNEQNVVYLDYIFNKTIPGFYGDGFYYAKPIPAYGIENFTILISTLKSYGWNCTLGTRQEPTERRTILCL